MSHILEVDAAERARAAAGGGVYHFGAPNGGGYAVAGQQPVLMPTQASQPPVSDYLSEAVSDLLEADLDGTTCETLAALYDTCGGDAKPMAELQASLDADTLDDWLRLLMRCPVADADIAVLNFRDWAQRAAEQVPWIQREAARRAGL